MNEKKSQNRNADHWIIEKPASESQALISSGEAILEHVHRVAHEIEELVRQALSAQTSISEKRS